jgi:hypothetical protein
MLDFEFTPDITKEFLQSKYSDETYFEHYLGFPVTKKLFTSVLRSDKKPTCSFYRNKNGDLIYKDFGTGDGFNFIGLVMEMFNLNYYQAITKIASDFGLIKTNVVSVKAEIKESSSKILDTGPTYIQVTTKPFSEEELDWWNKFGIEQELLDKYKVFSCEHVFINGRLSVSSTPNNYIFGYYFGTDNGRELWKIYMPLRKKFRFLNNISMDVLQGYEQLPESGPLLVITKSMKDSIVLNRLGIPAVAPNSEVLIISQEQMDEFHKRFKYIVFYWDRDYAGVTNLQKIRKTYPECAYFINPKNTAKDLSDCVEKFGLRYVRDQIPKYLKQLQEYYNEKNS